MKEPCDCTILASKHTSSFSTSTLAHDAAYVFPGKGHMHRIQQNLFFSCLSFYHSSSVILSVSLFFLFAANLRIYSQIEQTFSEQKFDFKIFELGTARHVRVQLFSHSSQKLQSSVIIRGGFLQNDDTFCFSSNFLR